MFEKYIKLIQAHKDNKKELREFLESIGLGVIDFNINGEVVDFVIPSSFKLKLHTKKQEILEFLKSKKLKSKNL